LRYGDSRVQALLAAVLLLAALLGKQAGPLSAGRVTNDPRCLRLHGLIERIPHTHRYRLTERGIQKSYRLSFAVVIVLYFWLAAVSIEAAARGFPIHRLRAHPRRDGISPIRKKTPLTLSAADLNRKRILFNCWPLRVAELPTYAQGTGIWEHRRICGGRLCQAAKFQNPLGR
jgi:hypothetical protein